MAKDALAQLLSKFTSFRPTPTAPGLEEAEGHLLRQLEKGFEPGGPYRGIWLRDAYFLGSFLLERGRTQAVARLAAILSSHQIGSRSTLVHGRGSPKTRFEAEKVDAELTAEFMGGLPTSLHEGSDEVYGFYPDIDSTCLFVALLGKLIDRTGSTELAKTYLPAIERALRYVGRRDIDGDSMPEQFENEDWADNLLRDGNVTYSQATYLWALDHAARVQELLGASSRAEETRTTLIETKKVMERKLWAGGSYCDSIDIYGSYIPTASQDTSLFLLVSGARRARAVKHLEYLHQELWTENGPLNLVPARSECRPRRLRRNEYQNSTVWPWFTAVHSEAALRFGRVEEASRLLQVVFPYSFFEWYNPFSVRKRGFYPFRTSAAAVISVARRNTEALGFGDPRN
ncbi:MAG: GH116 family glycosyl hydrolase [Candidatus Geothermarchaeales archaeon]